MLKSMPMTLSNGPLARHFIGQVSKSALLTKLLPIGFGIFFIALSAAASFFPQGYDWRVHVISKLTSPVTNPEAYWIASAGIMLTMLLTLPFGGYVQQRLAPITPRLARVAGTTFALGFIIMAISMLAQLVEPVIGFRKLHTYLAQTAAGFFIIGMICCSASAITDRLRAFGGRAALPPVLASFWAGITLLPVGVLGTIVLLLVIGGPAEEIRQSFRHTPMWHLAFWEWIGAIMACAFLTGSVALLPIAREQNGQRTQRVTALSDENTPVSSV